MIKAGMHTVPRDYKKILKKVNKKPVRKNVGTDYGKCD
jgi:hypothetical protein